MENEVRCSLCHGIIAHEDLTEFDEKSLCLECLEEHTTTCDRCGARMWNEDSHSDGNVEICDSCYHHYYYRCESCDCLVHENETYYVDGNDEPFCYNCYQNQIRCINEYSYKPEPIFYALGECNRYFGVELEIDGAGESSDHAERILNIANAEDEHLYCKHDGSLDEGFEMVTHPMSICYHEKQMPWKEILTEAKRLGYISHQAGTCGLHIHVNRDTFGETVQAQDECIARVLYFFEKHWEELLTFSRRTERQLSRWASRYGLKENPSDILKTAKGDFHYDRYTCVNLTDQDTIEFRIFRGTLKYNTLIATLQLIDRICDIAICLSDDVIKGMSWTTFVSGCTQKELVQYLKERRLYVNEPVETEEEV